MNPYNTAMESLANTGGGGSSPPLYYIVIIFAAYALCFWLAFGETSPLRNKLSDPMQVMVLLLGPVLLVLPIILLLK